VAVIGQVLVQFVFRLTFGMSLAMALTPARLVTSGYFRVHLWVLMGLNTFAALALYSGRDGIEHTWVGPNTLLLGAVLLAVGSYVGAVVWLYERARTGQRILFLLSGLALLAALAATPWTASSSRAQPMLALDIVTSGWLMGTTMAGMLLGHWYLNTPTMQLVPLQRLVRWMTGAVIARAIVGAIGLGLCLASDFTPTSLFGWMVGFRWLSGLGGAFLMAVLTWYTLKIPNTQSATGILYAGVILVFLGELVSQLLSMDAPFPL
jgi:hypothetical protein